MKQTGTVVSVNGTEAKIRIHRESACGGNCASCGGCKSETVVTAENKAGAAAGDRVELEMPSSRVLGAAVWVYIIPIIFFVIGDIIFNRIFHSEGMAALGGLCAMTAIYLAIIVQNRKNKDKYRLVVEKII
ncbi:MAG: SoxR reducing system RseC family protein [Clostridia bacterium]|nr:SoxR reducing system RseC family protein [Clostridia bacterium]